MSKPKKPTAAKVAQDLAAAAASVLGSLVDDHEDCRICLAGEGQTHEEGSSCADLEAAFNQAKDAGFYK